MSADCLRAAAARAREVTVLSRVGIAILRREELARELGHGRRHEHVASAGGEEVGDVGAG